MQKETSVKFHVKYTPLPSKGWHRGATCKVHMVWYVKRCQHVVQQQYASVCLLTTDEYVPPCWTSGLLLTADSAVPETSNNSTEAAKAAWFRWRAVRQCDPGPAVANRLQRSKTSQLADLKHQLKQARPGGLQPLSSPFAET